ncbi:MAG: DUF423 domain-containing protein [Planctomycetota bacterium]
MSERFLIRLAALAGASGVLIGAFGAHGLPDFLGDAGLDAEKIQKRLAQFETAAKYHLVHAVAILATAALKVSRPKLQRLVGILFGVGILLFSGSLYLLVVTDTPKLGAITPLGGATWIVAWTLLLFSVGGDRSRT